MPADTDHTWKISMTWVVCSISRERGEHLQALRKLLCGDNKSYVNGMQEQKIESTAAAIRGQKHEYNQERPLDQ